MAHPEGPPPTVAINAIVVAYRGWPMISTALAALRDQSMPPQQTVVVDSGSDDGSTARIAAAHPEVLVTELGANRGYAAAVNCGFTLAGRNAELVLVLTQDCVLERDTLQLLVDDLLAAPSDVAAVGPLLGRRSDPEFVMSAGGCIDRTTWMPEHPGRERSVSEWRQESARAVEWLDGACILFRRSAVRHTGPLDERYFLYFEDVDYCLQLARAGLRVRCVLPAVAFQEPGFLPEYLRVRNRLRLIARHAGALTALRLLPTVAWREVNRSAEPNNRVDRYWGVVDFLLARFGPPRRQITLKPSSPDVGDKNASF